VAPALPAAAGLRGRKEAAAAVPAEAPAETGQQVRRVRISVIVPTYNRCDLLRRTLETLSGQRFPADEFEVIVTDDGSSDETAEVTRSFATRLPLRYIFQEDRGFRAAAARNAGARIAAAPVLAFLDCGTLAGPDFVRSHLAANSAAAGGHVVLGYCFGYRPIGETHGAGATLAELDPAGAVRRFGDDPLFRDIRHPVFAAAGFDLGRLAAPWFLFWTMNCSMRADTFWAAGGFDENFTTWGVEDIDLGYRLFDRGVRLVLSRDAWTVELPHERRLKSNFVSAARNARYFLKKHGGPIPEIAFRAFTTEDLDIEAEAAALASWTRQAAELDVSAELARAAREIPAGASVAVFGCGGTVPPTLPPCTLLDFDARLLASALADGRHTGYHAIGLRTQLPGGSVDVVIITSRLSGLWDRWENRLTAEARRVGQQVRGPLLAPVPGR
jgi:glycosyltransferase involved in cell wall biosynthesis